MNSQPGPIRPRKPSQDRLARLALERAVACAIITIDPGGIITSWNRAAEQMLGWRQVEAVGQDASMILAAGDGPHGPWMQDTTRDRGRATVERWHLRKDGTRFWGSNATTRLEDDETGEHLGHAMIVQDRTEEHEAGERLRASEALLRKIFDNSADCMKLLTPDGRLVFTNRPGLDLLEIDAFEHVRGKDWASLWPEMERSKIGAALAEALAGQVARFQGFCPTLKGTPKWWDVQVTAVPGSEGPPQLILVSSRDVTEHHANQEALRRGTERLQAAFSIKTVGVMFWSPDFTLSEVNDAVLTMTGFSREELLGKTWQELTPPEFHEASRRAVAGLTSAGEITPYEKQFYRKNRSRWWGLFAARRMEDEVVEFVLDVTDRRAAEEALHESDERFRHLADLSPALVWFSNPDGKLTYLNRHYYDLTGHTPEQALGDGWASVLHPDDVARVLAAWEDARHREVPFDAELRMRRATGEYRWYSARATPRRDEEGRVIGWLGSNADITPLKEAERTLRAAAETLEQQVAERTADRNRMWQLSTDIMLVAAFDGTIQAVNPAWTSQLGWQEGELLGRSFFDLVHPEDLALTMAEAASLADGHTTLRFENRYRCHDGSYVVLSWTAVPDENHIHAVGRDVTAEKEQAEALRQAEEALRQSQKMEAVGQLTGGLAHDFNNLLTGIRGSLELLTKRVAQGRTGELDRYVTAAQGAAERAAALTHRLLAFSRRQTLAPKPTDINTLIASMEELIRRTAGPGIAVTTALATDSWPTLCDPNQLENALLNLCINARDAMPDGGRLTIETAAGRLDARTARMRDMTPGEYVEICVADTGTGMTPDVIARAFEPFFTTKPIGQGTGLGLSMIYGFARQSGGQVRISSEAGAGTRVRIFLPRYRGRVMAGEAQPEPAEIPRAKAGETVLVVDDEPTVRMLITEVLEELGYAAIEASDGMSGLDVLQSDTRIDLLVTDVGLPGGINGRQMADAARQFRPDLKVLFITGYAESAVLGSGHLEPGMHVLAKPFALDVLATRMEAIITGR